MSCAGWVPELRIHAFVCQPAPAATARPTAGGAPGRATAKKLFRMNKLFHEIDLGTSRAVASIPRPMHVQITMMAAGALLLALLAQTLTPADASPPEAAIETAVAKLLKKMTVQEKARQLVCVAVPPQMGT
jgi:hypothetical protein